MTDDQFSKLSKQASATLGSTLIPPGWQLDRISGGLIIVVPPQPWAAGRVVGQGSRTASDRLLYSLANALLGECSSLCATNEPCSVAGACPARY